MVNEKERGQGLAEYALLILLIGLIVIIALAIFGNTVAGLFTNIIEKLPF